MVLFPDERVGDFVQEGVANIVFTTVAGEIEGDGNYFIPIGATSRPTRALIKFKRPFFQSMLMQKVASLLGNGFNFFFATRRAIRIGVFQFFKMNPIFITPVIAPHGCRGSIYSSNRAAVGFAFTEEHRIPFAETRAQSVAIG